MARIPCPPRTAMEGIIPALSDLIQNAKPISTGATAVYPYSPSLERRMKFESASAKRSCSAASTRRTS